MSHQPAHQRVAIDRHERASSGQRHRVPTNSTTQIPDDLARRKAGRFVIRDSLIGRLLQTPGR